MVVRVNLNTDNKGDLFLERTPDRDFLVRLADLRTMGFREPSGATVLLAGETFISLRSMAGVGFEFLETTLVLNITAEPRLLASQTFNSRDQVRQPVLTEPAQNSVFVNYALSAAKEGADSFQPGLAGEVGWRTGNFLFMTDASTVEKAPGEKRSFARLMSSVTHDDRQALRRTVLGDFFTPSREFGSGINLGGISVSKLYGLDPYFVQFPMQSVSGSVALPSDLEVYVDGQRIRTERLKPGEFELRDILAYGGARNVQLLLRDAFGRVQQLDYSFYFSDQPLRQGLHEYSYNLGAIRRDFGLKSNRYGPAAFTMFHRYGWSDALSLGVRADATKDFLSAGPMATAVLGSAGVASLAVTGSAMAGRRGAAALGTYSYQSNRWSWGASLRREWKDFATLADPPFMSNRKYEASLSAGYRLGNHGSVSLSHSVLITRPLADSSGAGSAQSFRVAALENRRISTLSYSVPLVSGWAALTASVSHLKEQSRGSRNEAFVGLTVFLSRDYSAAASYRADRDSAAQSVQLTKRQPLGEGLGFTLGADRATDEANKNLRMQSSLQYNAPAAIFRADLGRNRNQAGDAFDRYRLSVSGGIGLVGDTLSAGRPITGSFGVVKVGDLAGVSVLVNSQKMGETDTNGRLFIPALSPYVENVVALAPETIPIEYALDSVSRKISPSMRGGTVIEFAATRLQAFTGQLSVRQGSTSRLLEFSEISFSVQGKVQSAQTGRGGEFYLENVQPGAYRATTLVNGKPCLFNLVIPTSAETFVELGELECQLAP